jgi:hypothetical protein
MDTQAMNMTFQWQGSLQPAVERDANASLLPHFLAQPRRFSSRLLFAFTGSLTSRAVCANIMATPRFNSQHSKVVLDVSAFHSSSPFASQPGHHPMAKVARSPTIEAGQREARLPESVERVEDSYQDSLPMPPPPQHADNDDEDDLYSLSPKGRQSLDATVAKRKAQAQRVSSAARRMYVTFLILQSKHRSPK